MPPGVFVIFGLSKHSKIISFSVQWLPRSEDEVSTLPLPQRPLRHGGEGDHGGGEPGQPDGAPHLQQARLPVPDQPDGGGAGEARPEWHLYHALSVGRGSHLPHWQLGRRARALHHRYLLPLSWGFPKFNLTIWAYWANLTKMKREAMCTCYYFSKYFLD